MMLTCLEMGERDLTFASVHDSYWTHACYVNTMSDVLREKFVSMHSQPLLENLLESFRYEYPSITFPEVPERSTLDLQQVMQSPYFFH
jgi:DNA-directed RNA polymerase, mitochondrial